MGFGSFAFATVVRIFVAASVAITGFGIVALDKRTAVIVEAWPTHFSISHWSRTNSSSTSTNTAIAPFGPSSATETFNWIPCPSERYSKLFIAAIG